jgi:hypothetical protein
MGLVSFLGSKGQAWGERAAKQEDGAGEQSPDPTIPSFSPQWKIGHRFTFCVFIFNSVF